MPEIKNIAFYLHSPLADRDTRYMAPLTPCGRYALSCSLLLVVVDVLRIQDTLTH